MFQIENLPVAVKSDLPSPKMSKKYGFVSSLDIAKTLENEGWDLISANQRKFQNNSKEEDRQFAAHWLRFRKPTSELKDRNVGDITPEIYFRNSHNGSSGVVFEAGLFRLVCSNGLVVKDSSFADLKLRHSLKNISELKPMLDQFIHGFSNVSNRINEMKEVILSQEEQIEFAEISKILLWGQHVPKIQTEKVLQPRRQEDNENNLWSVYNRVQENLSKGGLLGEGKILTAKNEIRKIKTREIKDSFKYVSFNSKLWDVVENRLTTNEWVKREELIKV